MVTSRVEEVVIVMMLMVVLVMVVLRVVLRVVRMVMVHQLWRRQHAVHGTIVVLQGGRPIRARTHVARAAHRVPAHVLRRTVVHGGDVAGLNVLVESHGRP